MESDRPEFGPLFLEGIDRFNRRLYWDAHESWERLWLRASPPLKQFLQGLIQLAAAYHHLQRGRRSAAVRLFDSALGKLGPFPERTCGLDRASLVVTVGLDRDRAERGSPEDPLFPVFPVPDTSCFPRDEEW